VTAEGRPEPEFGAADVTKLTRLLVDSTPSAGATRVLAIDGRSGAGKSTLAALVAQQSGAEIVSLEYLYGGWDDLEGGANRLTTHLLEPLSAGLEAEVPQYDWLNHSWGKPRLITPAGLLVVEGVGAFARRAAPLISCGVWLDAPEEVRRTRVEHRDSLDLADWWDAWATQEQAHFAAEQTALRASVTILTG